MRHRGRRLGHRPRRASEAHCHASRVESVCSCVRYTVGECLARIVGRLDNFLPPREALHAWPRPEVAREAPQGGNAAYRAQLRGYPLRSPSAQLTDPSRPSRTSRIRQENSRPAVTTSTSTWQQGASIQVSALERDEIGPGVLTVTRMLRARHRAKSEGHRLSRLSAPTTFVAPKTWHTKRSKAAFAAAKFC